MIDLSSIIGTVPGALSVAECHALADVATDTDTVYALEVGHYLGLSTSVLLAALPADCELVTIDHHRGDAWCSRTSFEEFLSNVKPFIGGRSFAAYDDDMAVVMPGLDAGFGFVFYDADHTASAVAQFWDLAADLLDDQCTLCFDDADWAEQSTLRDLAAADGFEVIRQREFWRADVEDKYHPDTYTLEVMRRG